MAVRATGSAGSLQVTFMDDRLEFLTIPPSNPQGDFGSTVLAGLLREPKQLPPWLLYDPDGSALFEEITDLPEYYLTRTEMGLLERHADEMVEAAGCERQVVEFGSGSSRKTRLLLDALLRRNSHVSYVPIDISREFLRESSNQLLAAYPTLRIRAISAEYSDAVRALRHEGTPRLFLFLGSNIGNFEPHAAMEFLDSVVGRMHPSGRLLLGFDLVKDPQVLFDAYNDSARVTERFNKNLLLRINRELDGTFDPEAFEHHAPWVPERSRIEMHLVAKVDQAVHLRKPGKSIHFRAGESIHTENSYKYTVAHFRELCARTGLRVEHLWTDAREWFGVALLSAELPHA